MCVAKEKGEWRKEGRTDRQTDKREVEEKEARRISDVMVCGTGEGIVLVTTASGGEWCRSSKE